MSADRAQAAADLAALDADRTALADRVVPPWWFAPGLGLLLFAVSSHALDSPWVTLPAVLLFGVGVGLLVQTHRRTTGVWANTPPRVLAVWTLSAVAVLSQRWTRAWQRELRAGG